MYGERGGLVVEHGTLEREARGSKPTYAVLCSVLEQDTLLWGRTDNIQEAVAPPDMTEKLLTGTLCFKSC